MRAGAPTLIPIRGQTLPVDDGRPMRPVRRPDNRGRRSGRRRQDAEKSIGLMIAITVSVALHLVVIAVRFVMPQAALFKPPDSPLEIILVNAKSADRPVKPDAIAQYDLNGGGDNDRGRATSFLPRRSEVSDGETLKDSRSATQQIEQQQRRLFTQTRDSATTVAPEAPQKVETEDTALTTDLTTSKAIARLEAQIDKQTRDYNTKPRRGFIGPTTRGASYALYYAQWKDRVERIGTMNYPAEARGHIYGDLTLRVTLKPNGAIYNDEVVVVRSSGSPVLDRAARRIVLMGAPYAPFSEELKREFDVFEIFSTFRFTKGDALEMRTDHR
jgi:protein TonB